MRVLLAISIALMSPFAAVVAQPNLEAGQTAFEVCAGCHGFLAEGNALVNAPSLAGIEPWYLARQMRYFSTGIRGAAEADIHGQRMATMAGAVDNERELQDLIAYIGTLPAARPSATVAGDAQAGQGQFAACAACHGLEGSGNETLSSPGLTRLDDWYVVEQLRLFAEGLRGAQPEDTYGQQMRAIATTFSDEQTRRDLAAHIQSIGN